MTETNQTLSNILAPRGAGRISRHTRRKGTPLTPTPAQAAAPKPRLDAYPTAPNPEDLTDILIQDIAR